MANGLPELELEEAYRLVDGLLSPRGQQLWRTRTQLFDSTPTLSDLPATQDRLDREAFTRVLARRIRSMRWLDPNAPLFIHLHGPWGSGKTSILNLLRRALTERDDTRGVMSDPFLITEFNIWQYQRFDPPWWSLIGAITHQVGTQLGSSRRRRPNASLRPILRWVRLAVSHALFKIWSLRSATLGSGLIAILLGIALLWAPTGTENSTDLLKRLTGIFSLVGGAYAAGLILFGVLYPKPEDAAERFVGSRSDPLLKLERHIIAIVKQLGQPLVVLIDDLDRCDGSVVIRFLEGIQTLFKRAPVTFVVAADRNWVQQSFEISYKDFEAVSSTKGRPLGFLFLEKIFQLSVAVPPMSPEQQSRYWKSLLDARPSPLATLATKRTKELGDQVGRLSTESQIVDFVKNRDRAEQPFAARAAVLRLAAPDVELRTTHHRLEKFSALLELNPRGMKRLVMAYGMNQATDLLLGQFTDLDQLALWTILSMRWPKAAEWLERNPDAVAEIKQTQSGSSGPPNVDAALRDLICEKEFRAVLSGGAAVPDGLTADTLHILSLRGSAR